jgi:antitoxin (DNA-binding transcriptional repressor) of toxin-antitoxin stability system
MMKTLRESKAKLSELVELASRGEDVLISVRGKVKARLTRLGTPEAGGANWARELRALHRAYGKARAKSTIEEILAEGRADRV